ncbi:hypothetical protein [Sphingomonas immobilis]|uniref:Uncharacterized protein n=1 Tax=Sphingomonas immobilis TaxID=3063997 RepID=A0ABT8ZW27_9SPHN|nr:hypothetical protein [Sphingomonas sp. CA1-15]MDO7841780.1 hypothetical protein [Sphingomonas sp. CA1-15]
MNIKSLSPRARSLVEVVRDVATDEKFELVEFDEDGDIVTLTFSRDIDVENGGDDESDEEEEDD